MKDNFLLKKSQQEVFDTLTDEEAGKLIKGIFKYMRTGNSELTGMMKAIFIPIKNDIDKNEESYQKRCEKNRENIKKRWEKDSEEIQEDTNVYERIPVEYESIPNDTDNNHISYITNHNSYIINHKSNNHIDIIKQIIDYLNSKTNSNFKYTSKTTQNKIIARLNEGYSLDDFIVVIDNKCLDWLNDSKMNCYLRPETLFGTKFESYLNQRTIKNKRTLKDISMAEIDRAIELERGGKTEYDEDGIF